MLFLRPTRRPSDNVPERTLTHRLFWVCSGGRAPTECRIALTCTEMSPQSSSSHSPSSHPSSGEGVGRFRGSVRATLWPTLSLVGNKHWFDELYLWTEGGSASTTERAGIQIHALRNAFDWLAYDLIDRVGVTISFGTIERSLDPLTDLFEKNLLLAHRMFVMLRGAPQRLRSRYRLRAFADMLRGWQFPVGYRISAPRISMELAGIDLVQPIFAKILATTSSRDDAWNDLALEVRALSLDTKTTIVGALETRQQLQSASRVGFEFGQGRAIRMPYPPPTLPTRS